jgi:hypothetical protein
MSDEQIGKPRSRLNNIWVGLIAGIIIPVIAILIAYAGGTQKISFAEFIDSFIYLSVFSHLISLCALPNLLLFFIFIWKKLLYSARGAIFATLIWAVVVIIIKFFIQDVTW